MTHDAVMIVLVALCGLLAAGLALAAYLWQRAKAEHAEAKARLEQLRQSVEIGQRNFDARLEEKEKSLERALGEKEAACVRLIEAKDKACAAALAEKTATCERLIADKGAACARQLAEKNEEIDRFLREKEKSFAAAVRTLQEQFANLAATTLRTQSGELAKTNSERLEGVLKPLREQLETLRSATEKTQTEHARLAEAIGKDVGRISDVARELAGVSEALSSNTSFQGRKGEEILAEKLRQAGLEENVNFFLQTGTQTDRPDAQVCDTENRWLIIDSKVALTSYFQYVEAKDEATRRAKLAEHVRRVHEKIEQLAKKKYPKVFAEEHKDRNYLPVTAMFVGYEAPLLEALKADPTLWRYAAENNVVLVTPLTLLAYLRLVYLAWQHEKEARSQAEIVNTARELLTRMNAFLTTFENMGKALADANERYEDAKGVLVDAPRAQTIAKAANKLISLHVKLESRKGAPIRRAACLKEMENAEPPTPAAKSSQAACARNGQN